MLVVIRLAIHPLFPRHYRLLKDVRGDFFNVTVVFKKLRFYNYLLNILRRRGEVIAKKN